MIRFHFLYADSMIFHFLFFAFLSCSFRLLSLSFHYIYSYYFRADFFSFLGHLLRRLYLPRLLLRFFVYFLAPFSRYADFHTFLL